MLKYRGFNPAHRINCDWKLPIVKWNVGMWSVTKNDLYYV